MLQNLIQELKNFSNSEQAKILQRFFKTGRGEYGEGDIFLGIRVPVQRKIVKEYLWMGLPKIQKLLDSKIHEHRLSGLIILNEKYKKATDRDKEEIFNFYLKNTQNINNWDLVDLSAPNIVGNFLSNKNKRVLYKLVQSENLWERRIAIVSTYTFIKKQEFEDT